MKTREKQRYFYRRLFIGDGEEMTLSPEFLREGKYRHGWQSGINMQQLLVQEVLYVIIVMTVVIVGVGIGAV